MTVAKKTPPKRNKSTKIPPKEEPVSIVCYCRKCMVTKSHANYYDTTNPSLDSNGKMSICKDCINEIYDRYYRIFNNVDNAMRYLCEDTDVVYFQPSVDGIKTRMANAERDGKPFDRVFGHYKAMLAQNKDNVQGMRYRDSIVDGNSVINIKRSNEEGESIEVEYLRQRWGRDLDIEDLKFLEEKYSEWENGYEVDTKNRQLIVENLVYEELFIYKERQKGSGDVSKRLKNIKELMGLGNLSPRQENASESAEFNSFPVMIAHIEQHKPCYIENHAMKDIDNMGHHMKTLDGLIARSAGNPNDNTMLFEEEYAEETMDLSALASGD